MTGVQTCALPILQFSETLDILMDQRVLFGMMLLVTISSLATAILYLIDNRLLLRQIAGKLRTGIRNN